MSRRTRPTWEEDRKGVAVRTATHERLLSKQAEYEAREDRGVTLDEIIRAGLDALDALDSAEVA